MEYIDHHPEDDKRTTVGKILWNTSAIGNALEAKSNTELAALLDEAANEMEIDSPLFGLLVEAAERLKQ